MCVAEWISPIRVKVHGEMIMEHPWSFDDISWEVDDVCAWLIKEALQCWSPLWCPVTLVAPNESQLPVFMSWCSPLPYQSCRLIHVTCFGQRDISKHHASRGLISTSILEFVPLECSHLVLSSHFVRKPKPVCGEGTWKRTMATLLTASDNQ